MSDQAYIVALEVENRETAEVELEYAVCLSLPEVMVTTVGTQGPPGAAFNEDDAVFAKRVDFADDTTIYRGEAAVGTTDAQPLWRIRRITLAGDGDVTEEWASGSAAFDKSWNDRATLGYS